MKAFFQIIIFIILINIAGCMPPVEKNEEVAKLLLQTKENFENKNYKKAIKVSEKILKIDFRNQQAYEIMANSYEFLHEYNKALEAWYKSVFSKDQSPQRAQEIEKNVQRLKRLLVIKKSMNKAFVNKDIHKLIEIKKKLKGTHNESMILLVLGDYFMDNGQPVKAILYYKETVEKFPNSPEKKRAEEKLEKLE
ncbi:tetratricopeptide repeat protein [Chlamydiota bacterium]